MIFLTYAYALICGKKRWT